MKRLTKSIPILFLALAGFLFTSCLKDTYTENLNKEKNEIAAYINSQYPGAQPNADGLYRIVQEPGTGDSLISISDYAIITYTGKFFDETIFDSTDTTVLLANGYYRWLETGGPFTISMQSGFYGMVEGLAKMKEGCKMTLIMPSSLSYGDFKPRVYDVKVLKVYHDIVASRKAEFDTAMIHLGFDLNKDTTTSGLFMKIDSLSMIPSGVSYPKIGDTVAVKYTGKLIDSVSMNMPKGRTYIVEDSVKFIVGSSNYLYFFKDALTKMRIGMKTTIYVPSHNGFGSSAMLDLNGTGQIILPPYSNFMLENAEFIGYATTVKNNGKVYWIIDKNHR